MQFPRGAGEEYLSYAYCETSPFRSSKVSPWRVVSRSSDERFGVDDTFPGDLKCRTRYSCSSCHCLSVGVSVKALSRAQTWQAHKFSLGGYTDLERRTGPMS